MTLVFSKVKNQESLPQKGKKVREESGRLIRVLMLIIVYNFIFPCLTWASGNVNDNWPSHSRDNQNNSNVVSWVSPLTGIEWRVFIPRGGFPNRSQNYLYVTKISSDGSNVYSHSVIEYQITNEHRMYRILEEKFYSRDNKLIKHTQNGAWIDTENSNASRSMDPMYDFITALTLAYDYNNLSYDKFRENPPIRKDVIDILAMMGNNNYTKWEKEKLQQELALKNDRETFKTFIDFRSNIEYYNKISSNNLESIQQFYNKLFKNEKPIEILSWAKGKFYPFEVEKQIIFLIRRGNGYNNGVTDDKYYLFVTGKNTFNTLTLSFEVIGYKYLSGKDIDYDGFDELILTSQDESRGCYELSTSIITLKNKSPQYYIKNIAQLEFCFGEEDGRKASEGQARIMDGKIEFREVVYKRETKDAQFKQIFTRKVEALDLDSQSKISQ